MFLLYRECVVEYSREQKGWVEGKGGKYCACGKTEKQTQSLNTPLCHRIYPHREKKRGNLDEWNIVGNELE